MDKIKKPAAQMDNELTMDDFTTSLDCRNLTEENKQNLFKMANYFKEQLKKKGVVMLCRI